MFAFFSRSGSDHVIKCEEKEKKIKLTMPKFTHPVDHLVMFQGSQYAGVISNEATESGLLGGPSPLLRSQPYITSQVDTNAEMMYLSFKHMSCFEGLNLVIKSKCQNSTCFVLKVVVTISKANGL